MRRRGALPDPLRAVATVTTIHHHHRHLITTITNMYINIIAVVIFAAIAAPSSPPRQHRQQTHADNTNRHPHECLHHRHLSVIVNPPLGGTTYLCTSGTTVPKPPHTHTLAQ